MPAEDRQQAVTRRLRVKPPLDFAVTSPSACPRVATGDFADRLTHQPPRQSKGQARADQQTAGRTITDRPSIFRKHRRPANSAQKIAEARKDEKRDGEGRQLPCFVGTGVTNCAAGKAPPNNNLGLEIEDEAPA